MKLIGRGSFTKCYLMDCGEKVLLKSEDPIKEAMANGFLPEHELFPKVEHSNIEGCYEMEFYPRTRGLKSFLDSDQYVIYKELRSVAGRIQHSINHYDSYSQCYEAFETIDCEELREVMIEALNGCSDYGSDVCFEISPRNVAVKNGKLILLDCFFLKSELLKTLKR